MSVIDTIRGKAPSPPATKFPQPALPIVRRKLDEAQAALAAQEQKCAELGVDVAMGEIDPSVLTTERKVLYGLRQDVEQLQAAAKVAEQRDKTTLEAQRQSIRKTQLAAARKHLQARDAAAAALSAALTEASKQYRLLVEHSAQAQAAKPIGLNQWPGAEEFKPSAIARLVAAEMYRVSADVVGVGIRNVLPGAAAPDIMHKHNPQGVAPLAETISKTSAGVAARLTEFVKGAAE
jgi:hypothetical protein